MTRMRLLSISLLAAGLVLALTIGGSATAARGVVVCKLKTKHGKRVVVCPRNALRGRRGAKGKRGAAGPAGPAGPAGAPAGSGSGLNLNFNARLTVSNNVRELTIGSFNITAAAKSSGACEAIKLRVAANSRVAIGSGEKFAPIAAAEVVNLTDGTNSNMFTAVSNDGVSTMSGIVGAVTIGNVCVVSGYVTGV